MDTDVTMPSFCESPEVQVVSYSAMEYNKAPTYNLTADASQYSDYNNI